MTPFLVYLTCHLLKSNNNVDKGSNHLNNERQTRRFGFEYFKLTLGVNKLIKIDLNNH